MPLKFTRLVFAAVLVVAGICGCQRVGRGPNAAKPLVKIGVIAPFSGDLAFAGDDIRSGFVLAREEFLKSHPDSKCDYELLFEDNRFELSKTVLAARKLIDIDHVDALVTLWDGSSVVAPLAEKAKVLHFAIRWDYREAKDNVYTLVHETQVDDYARATLKLLQERGWKRIALLSANAQSFERLYEEFEKANSGDDVRIVFHEKFQLSERNFRTLVAKARAAKPDAYVLFTYPPATEILLRQLRQRDPWTPITGTFEDVRDIKLLEGLSYVSTYEAKPEFAVLFQNRFGHPFALRAPHAFNIFNLIAGAYEKNAGSDKPSMEKIVESIANTRDFPIMLQGRWRMDPEGILHTAPFLRTVKNGQTQTLNEF